MSTIWKEGAARGPSFLTESVYTKPSAEAVARRLQAGGVKAAAKTVAASGEEGQALAAAAAEAGCDLLVMGGYGHSRLREMILGGVTRHMLASAPVPVLMAH